MNFWIFPGQGAQYVGMAADVINHSASVRELFVAASEQVGVDFIHLVSQGPAEELVKTSNTQPCIYLHSLALAQLLKEKGLAPSAVAGHSLGEYSALAAAGWIDPLDGLKLVRLRGEAMYQAGLDLPGTMAAVIGMEGEDVARHCATLTGEGLVIQAANFNCPGQVAISGSLEGVSRAEVYLKEQGARMIKRLEVSGAFHSPLMEPAREKLAKALAELEMRQGTAPVYCNVTGSAVREPEELRALLIRQLTETVRWEPSMRSALADGYTSFVELGPGKVLSGLMRRIDKSADVRAIDTWAEFLTFTGEEA
jgi:[acyl-carrier-protein] S-malonyltransferase